MASKVSFSRQHSSLEDIEAYYSDSESALNYYFEPSDVASNFPARFIGYNRKEIDDELKSRKEALDRMCSLELLAVLEARLRIDYLVRSQKKKKDDLSKVFRCIYKIKKNKASLKDDLIRVWKNECSQHKTRLDELGKALDYRHWLAHGRYWQPKRSPHIAKYDYLSVYTLASDIIENMDLHEN
jgi:hypothetical protein